MFRYAGNHIGLFSIAFSLYENDGGDQTNGCSCRKGCRYENENVMILCFTIDDVFSLIVMLLDEFVLF
jgi:hypothetical protein